MLEIRRFPGKVTPREQSLPDKDLTHSPLGFWRLFCLWYSGHINHCRWRVYLKIQNQMANSVNPDVTARYEPSHLVLHCLQWYMFWFVGVNYMIRAAPFENVSSSIIRQCRPRSASTYAQYDQDRRCPCPLTDSLDTTECLNGAKTRI